ncbi:hypothetical protein [Saccharophagus degradans]|uniref:Uncharacterized protein n=1 Tax=Saccharophagus degradans TaxID=86304 RepID=A0AAW7X6P8_9GAMM|nr:hypothetical protein [Saccharophagus degradans]MDO6422291.1 hypothetical protein [Saccharophagus degradans]MDO6607434.1 hypothetical protein [Saccharophagus degradans]
MSIVLLQTMEWSKLSWNQSFEKVIPIDLLLPKTGSVYSVNFSKNEDFVEKGTAFILWTPPHSELNGWDDKRPTEILRSYVLKGFLKPVDNTALTYDFKVESRAKLIDYFELADEEYESPLSYIGQPDGTSRMQWKDTGKVLMSKVGDYIYLSGSECETSLEIILSREAEKICVHYSATLHLPTFYDTKITKYYLSNFEQDIFEHLISKAVLIEDNSYKGVLESQVLGAEYW